MVAGRQASGERIRCSISSIKAMTCITSYRYGIDATLCRDLILKVFGQFVVGALFAGQLNSGINAAYVLAWLALDSDAMVKAREELEAVSSRYCDQSVPLLQRLSQLPVEAWENDFKFMDLCLKDSIRLNTLGTAFRRNLGSDIKLATGEVIPTGAFLVSEVQLYWIERISRMADISSWRCTLRCSHLPRFR